MNNSIPQEVLDNFIEVSNDLTNSEREKENRKLRQPNTTDVQISKMLAFAKAHNEGLMAKTTYNLLWESLAAELNDVGPPDHTSVEWKKIWSEFKKRKRSRNESIDCIETGGLGQSSCGAHPVADDQRLDLGDPTSKRVHIDSDVAEKLGVLIAKQDSTIENQNILIGLHKTIIDKLDIITNFLHKITKS